MMKKLLAFSLALLLTILVLPQVVTQASSGSSFSLSISDNSISAGDDFQVTVSGKKLSDLYAYEVNLTYDTSRLVFVKGVTEGGGFAVNPIVNGNKIQIAHTKIGNAAGQNGDVTLATLTFHAASQGKADIGLDSVKMVNSQLATTEVSSKSKASVNIKASGHVDRVFKSDIVNETKLVDTISSKVAAANKSGVKVEMADIKGHWGEKTIGAFVKLQFIKGYGDGTFHPNGNITRAEFAAIISRVFDINGGGNQPVVLNDINRHWGKDAIEKLAGAGVITGYDDGTFKPNKTINREEMVVILSRIVDLSKVDKDASKGNFADIASASSFAANQIKDAAKAGIISGKGNGLFDPKGNSTRAEALTIVLNALKLNPQIKTILDSLK
ncbi:S-layer homology domain-containing protein [Bacillus sp. FJAT-28004]|uniref:S-layer homology domain-containing protein n=1 Tax=Bacillus sp. FJAT-28004 TaxID=1679165 RepID=UPI0006B3F9BA|nr:S-layer homology domain-containing protein [Bacillus sp. FJAT-28004]